MACSSCGGGRQPYITPGHPQGGAACPCRGPGRMLVAEDLEEPPRRMLVAEDLAHLAKEGRLPDAPFAAQDAAGPEGFVGPDYGGAAALALRPGSAGPGADAGPSPMRLMGALGTPPVSGDQVCQRLFGPGGEYENFGLLQICRINARGRSSDELCAWMEDNNDLAEYAGYCRDSIGFLAAEAFEALPSGETPSADGPWRDAEPQDVSALQEALAFSVELARAMLPDKVRKCEEEARLALREWGRSVAYPMWTVGDHERYGQGPIYLRGALPSGYRLFLAASGGAADGADLAQATGVAPIPGDYLAPLQCHGWYYRRHPNGFYDANLYRFIQRRGPGRGLGVDRILVRHPQVPLVTPGAPLPPSWPAVPGAGRGGGFLPGPRPSAGGGLLPIAAVVGGLALLANR